MPDYELDTLQDIYPGYNLNQYLDSGGFKDVYKGNVDGEDVVLKLWTLESRAHKRRAERETEAMEKIDHPNFVDIIESFEDEINGQSVYIIVEEWIDGKDLSDVIKEDGGSFELGIDVLRTLLSVLEELSANNLVHRDIKPDNIRIGPEGKITLLDVGIVRFQDRTSLTPSRAPRGPSTPQYAPPELLENNKDAQDVRTDLFSTGIVFFEAVTAEHPFNRPGESITEAIKSGNRRESIESEVDDDLASALSQIYQRLTETQMSKRYISPEQAMKVLDAKLEVEP